MSDTPRGVSYVRSLLPAVALVAGCAAESVPEATAPPSGESFVAWYGETCFEDADAQPITDTVASFDRGVAVTREYTDERGCVAVAGFNEHMYTVTLEGRPDAHQVYIADGDSIRVRFGGEDAGVEYVNGPSLSATIVELANAKKAPEVERRRVIEQALRKPSSTRVHAIGLLASFELRGDWTHGAPPKWDNHHGDSARELLATVPPDSPWLAVWPTAPIGAALTLGYEPNEHPAVRAMVEHDQAGPVAANVLLLELQTAKARGDHTRAAQINEFFARTPALQAYASLGSAGHG
jgi:hypothetical protein